MFFIVNILYDQRYKYYNTTQYRGYIYVCTHDMESLYQFTSKFYLSSNHHNTCVVKEIIRMLKLYRYRDGQSLTLCSVL